MNLKRQQLDVSERRLFFDLPLVVLSLFVVVELVWPGLSHAFAGWPLVLSVFLVGMPHGATDLAVSQYLTRPTDIREQFHRFTGYLTLLAASLLVIIVVPSFGLAAFVVVSAIHFGLADARILASQQFGPSPRAHVLMAAVMRGSLILALPFFLAPAESLKVFENIVTIAGGARVAVDSSVAVSLAGLVLAAVALAHIVVTATRILASESSVAASELLETGVLVMTFAVLHPLFAMGLYVIAWHSWRHMHVLTRFLPVTTSKSNVGRLLAAVARLHIRSLPLLAPTVAIFAAIAWWRLDVWSSEMLAALTIAIFAVVTLPHHFLVERLFRHFR